jgi:AcrR family transcriptional regulator
MGDGAGRAERDEATGTWTRLGRFLRRVPRQDRARAVVGAILEAAEDGIDVAESGKLQSLFARAGVAAGSFYEYFGSRDALLGAVVERITDRNFETFLTEIDAVTEVETELEPIVRRSADRIIRHYLRHPSRLRTVVRLADRLGLLPRVAEERDRFADLVADRAASFLPSMSPDLRRAAFRAGSDAVVGVLIVSLFRTPMPAVDDVSRAAGDASWGVVRLHVERAARG